MLQNRFHKWRGHRLSALAALVLGAACGNTNADFQDLGPAGNGAESGWTFLPQGSDPGGKGSTANRSSGGGAGANGGGAQAGSSGAVSTAGAGGGVLPPLTFKCGAKKPNQPVITSFDGFLQDRWMSPGNLDGGVYVYPDTLEPKAGDFFRFENQVEAYTGIGVWFSGCIDGSKYRGVRFSVSGNAGTSGSVNFFLITNRDKYVDEQSGNGSCVPADPVDFWPTCHPPGVTLQVTAQPTTVSIPWTAFREGVPAATTDGSDVLALEWAFHWQEGGTPYAASLTIDNLAFYDDGVGGSGGGSGGSGGRGGNGGTGGGGGSGGSGTGGAAGGAGAGGSAAGADSGGVAGNLANGGQAGT